MKKEEEKPKMAASSKTEIINKQQIIPDAKSLYPYIRKAVNSTLKYENINQKCEVSVSLVDNREIRNLNKNFRKIDRSTDVLSFPSGDYPSAFSPVFLGDVIISLEQAAAQAKEYGYTLEDEVSFLTSHSVLHLLGYDHTDKESEKDMYTRQDNIMKMIGSNRKS